jgi:cytochrome c peroxidase
MNCHNGPLFTDNQFHNNGFAGADKGLYTVTHKAEDIGKMKTPSLRDVMKTSPWMHDGNLKYMMDILPVYNKGLMYQYDKLIKQLFLTPKEVSDLLAFLNAISSPPMEFKKPVLPQ